MMDENTFLRFENYVMKINHSCFTINTTSSFDHSPKRKMYRKNYKKTIKNHDWSSSQPRETFISNDGAIFLLTGHNERNEWIPQPGTIQQDY